MTTIIKFLKKYRLVLAAVLLLVIGFLLRGYITSLQDTNQELDAALSIQLDSTTTLRTKNQDAVYQVEHIKKTSAAQLKKQSDSIFNLQGREQKLVKEVSKLTVIAQSVRLGDTIKARYTSDQPDIANLSCDTLAEILQYAVFTPAPFNYTSDSISLEGIVETDGVAITKVDILDTLYHRDIKLKTGFLNLGRREAAQIYHTNSLFHSNGAAVYAVDKTPGWWYKTWKPAVAAGIASAITYFIVNSLKQ